ncbi:hypothetical protein BD289DRAFT_427908 [Coniella lustricola]|uniref:Uncharacterized protein n=1 Tax=Coniella lustricola TaxID=2025994 RepID=A0A2T3AEF9_9PEZI|nr:hypothetical protein BD289DRAFT_427908 [Coniella lustricola]
MDKLGGGKEAEGLNTQTKFYAYDVKRFLERLASQGRCKYREDWHSYGLVARPDLTLFPESLIVWHERNEDKMSFEKHPEDMVLAPRFSDCRTWEDLIQVDEEYESGSHEPLNTNVIHYFHCLAYRWGCSIRQLQAEERNERDSVPSGRQQQQQQQSPVSTMDNMDAVLKEFQVELNHQAGGKDLSKHSNTSPLIDLWRATLGADASVDETSTPASSAEPITQNAALAIIRKGIIDECVQNNSMLFPGRSTDYTNPQAPKTRESIWDWATPEVRGHLNTKFFSLDRWPVQLQTIKKQQQILGDDIQEVNLQQLWDPVLEDPTPWSYYRPKPTTYGERREQIKHGYQTFPMGDTPLKMKAVLEEITAKAAVAMGWEPGSTPHGTSRQQHHSRPGMLRTLTTFLGLKRPRPESNDIERGEPRRKLPRVDPALIPRSIPAPAT